MFAGVNGNNDLPGQSAQGEVVAARRRRLFAQLQDRAPRRLRALLGAVELPGAEQRDQQLRPDRLHAEHASARRPPARRPSSLTNPFPNGLVQPLGSAPRRAVRRRHDDQLRRSEPHGAARAAVLGRPPARAARRDGDRPSATSARAATICRSAARSTPSVNINQLDPKYLALGATVLSQAVPNPFFGIAAAGPLATQANIDARAAAAAVPAVPEHPGSAGLRRRQPLQRGHHRVEQAADRDGFGGRVSYTYSVLKDNQIGETNFYTNNGNGVPLNNYNYIASMPACTATNPFTTACFDPLVGVRHTASSTCRTASSSRRSGSCRSARIARSGKSSGSATRSPAAGRSSAVINLQSGFPIGLTQSDNTLLRGQRTRPNLTGAGFETSGELRRSAGVGRSSDRDLDQPGGGHRGAGGHVRQRAALDHRRPDAADHQHRPVGRRRTSGSAAASRRRSSSR